MTKIIPTKTVQETSEGYSIHESLQHLWRTNPVLSSLLGLCPVFAVSHTLVTALGLGIATLGVMLGAGVTISLTRHCIPESIRLPVFVLVIATLVTCVMLIMQVWAFSLYQQISLFVQIIVTNCLILGRIEVFASRQPLWPSLVDSLMTGVGFLLVLLILGSLREIVGSGTWGVGLDMLLGPIARTWHYAFESYGGFLIVAMPPGAFITLGLLLAVKNWLARN